MKTVSSLKKIMWCDVRFLIMRLWQPYSDMQNSHIAKTLMTSVIDAM
jgi:hypothetical protein